LGDVSNLPGQVTRHRVHRIGEVFPSACDAGHVGLAAQAAFSADLAGHASDLAGEGVELIDHRVDGFLQQQNLAADVHRDLLGQVAVRDGGGDLRDVTDLTG